MIFPEQIKKKILAVSKIENNFVNNSFFSHLDDVCSIIIVCDDITSFNLFHISDTIFDHKHVVVRRHLLDNTFERNDTVSISVIACFKKTNYWKPKNAKIQKVFLFLLLSRSNFHVKYTTLKESIKRTTIITSIIPSIVHEP